MSALQTDPLSDHQRSGQIRTSTEYNFEGQPLLSLMSSTNTGVGDILRTYTYNVIGQLDSLTHQVGTEARRTIVRNHYNDLGQLIGKKMPEISSDTLQKYGYNIRGWLKSIGSNLASGYKQTNYYQESGAATPRWNGNISRIDWSGKAVAPDDPKVRTYNYTYDNANRLKHAGYGASGEAGWFTVTGITYDANGNIHSMERSNQKTASTYGPVDDLEYSYHRYGNKLSQVKDNNTALSYTAKDFKERGATPYPYDDNGNMISNMDKQISLITYNHLNLPEKITFTTGAELWFAYDAAGNKLTQKVYNSSGVLTKTQDYIGEIVLLDGALDYLIHEEGRVAYELGTYQYEYFLKDHLGNIRQVLRNPSTQVYMATMETENAATEEQEFVQVQASRQSAPEHNKTAGGNEVAWLNADRGRMVGPGRTQEIWAGDSLTLQVYGKYLEEKNQKVNAGSFMAAGGKQSLIADLNELAVSTQRAGGGNPIALFNLANIMATDFQQKETPEAYLIYALYDQDSNRYEVGKKVLSRNAANQHEVLEENMYISKDGYMETFVVNETSEDVWFDNLMVMSMTSPIAQETHYDPWGLELTGLGYQYGGIKANKYLYNGKELIEDNGLQYYDYGARMYDPAIGRWGVVDPMADLLPSWSPYVFSLNNPVLFIDPDGQFPYTFHVRALAPTGSLKGSGFHDDGRGFSTNAGESSRIKQNFTVDPTAQTFSGGTPTSDPTYWNGINTGTAKNKGGVSTPEFGTNSLGNPTATLSSNFAGSNPALNSFFGFAPDIEVSSALSITENLEKGQLTVSFDLSSKQFPATEGFVQDSAGNSVFLGGAAAFGNPGNLVNADKKQVSTIDLIIGINDKGVFQNVTMGGTTYSLDDFNNLHTSKPAGPFSREDKDK